MTFMRMKQAVAVAFLVGVLCHGTAFAQEWYEGGTLHQATVGKYLQGSLTDALATTADWVCAGAADSEIQKLKVDDIKEGTVAVAMCVLCATTGEPSTYGQKAADVAVLCMQQLKKDYPWFLTK